MDHLLCTWTGQSLESCVAGLEVWQTAPSVNARGITITNQLHRHTEILWGPVKEFYSLQSWRQQSGQRQIRCWLPGWCERSRRWCWPVKCSWRLAHPGTCTSMTSRQSACEREADVWGNDAWSNFCGPALTRTSWPGRWIPLHNAWQTHPRSPEESPQNRLSKHHHLWHRGSSPPHCSGYLSQNGKGSARKETTY